MKEPYHSANAPTPFSFAGRLLCALAAGAGFAVLAYEPRAPAGPERDDGTISENHPSASRLDGVTDDDADPRPPGTQAAWLVPGDARMRSPDIFASSSDQQLERQARPQDGPAPASRWTGREALVQTVETHSRGPPSDSPVR